MNPVLDDAGLGESGCRSDVFEGGDGFDESSDGESVADTAWFTNEVENPTFAGQGDGDAHQGRDAGAVNLRDAIEVHDNFASGFVHDGHQRVGELVAGFADGQTAVDIEDVDPVFVANVNFDGRMLGHVFTVSLLNNP
jgi:hypothetical protein